MRAYAQRLDPDGWAHLPERASIVKVGDGESLSAPLPPAPPALVGPRQRTAGGLHRSRVRRHHPDSEWPPCRPAGRCTRRGRPISCGDRGARKDRAAQRRGGGGLRTPSGHGSASGGQPGCGRCPSSASHAGRRQQGQRRERIAADYGVPLERVMMVGDAENDVAAMRVVGHPVPWAMPMPPPCRGAPPRGPRRRGRPARAGGAGPEAAWRGRRGRDALSCARTQSRVGTRRQP